MFKQVGKKLRIFAKALFVLGILASLGGAVALYLLKILELPIVLAIGAGGVVVFWILSWTLYAIGDTHARLERMEEKLIPKPSYTDYLASSTPAMAPCEICGRTTDLINAVIRDELGTRYRKVCRECFAAKKCSVAE